MRYFVLDKNGNIICNRGGYSTRWNALEGRRSFCSPIFTAGIEFAKSKGLPPGGKFAEEVRTYIEENSEIVEVSEITYRAADGRTIVLKV